MYYVLIDNGHGVEKAGKRSPVLADGTQLREYKFARIIAGRLKEELAGIDGITPVLITPEECDISLKERCKRINKYCDEHGSRNCLVVSIHNNACGNGSSWCNAHGWAAYVSKNASNRSKKLATALAVAAGNQGLKVRLYKPGQMYWQQNLAICRDTKCAAVLTENLFMDNIRDCRFLLSKVGEDTIVKLHKQGIINYVKGL